MQVQGLDFRFKLLIQASGFRAKDIVFNVLISKLWVGDCEFRIQGLVFGV